MQRQPAAEELGEQRRGDEKHRRLLDERLAGERRHQPVAALEDVIDQPEGIGFIRLPGVVADEAEPNPCGKQGEEPFFA